MRAALLHIILSCYYFNNKQLFQIVKTVKKGTRAAHIDGRFSTRSSNKILGQRQQRILIWALSKQAHGRITAKPVF